MGLPPGTDGPAVTGIDLKTSTIFASTPDLALMDLALPQAAYATIFLTQPGVTVPAEGLLATLTVDTTGVFGGTFDLLLGGVLPGLPNGPFQTDLGDLPIHLTNGTLRVVGAGYRSTPVLQRFEF